jgi:YVTN family beta-propeller protein
VSVSGTPGPLAYAPETGDLYVVDAKSNNVTVVNGENVLGTVSVGASPAGIVYDPSDGYAYVSNSGGGSVTVLNGTSVVGTVRVQSGPLGGAYDGADGYVYVPNYGSGTVSVINGTHVVATLRVRGAPGPPAYDPMHQQVYVPDLGDAYVSILSGTESVANVSVSYPYYTSTTGVVYDPVDGKVYVAMYYYGFYGLLNWIDNRTAGAAPLYWGGPELSLAVDDGTGDLYVADQYNGEVGVFDGLASLGAVVVGTSPTQIADDPANGMVYVADSGSANVSVIDGTSLAGTIPVGKSPNAVVYAPGSGMMLVSVGGAKVVQLISTVLAVGPSSASPSGNPLDTLDVGQTAVINATVWGIGSGGLAAAATEVPSNGSGCSDDALLLPARVGEVVELSCTPDTAGDYTVQLNVTDANDSAVWSSLTVHVYPDPNASEPVARIVGVGPVRAADIGEPVAFAVAVAGGTGNYSYQWTGLPASDCNSTGLAAIRCTFTVAGPLFVGVNVTDTDGATSVSPVLPFSVDPTLVATVPSAAAPSGDVGEAITFVEAPQGGTGNFSGFVWQGLPATGCTNTTKAQPTCVLSAATNLSIRVAFSDDSGAGVTSPILSFRVYPQPFIGALDATRTSLDVGQTVAFQATTSGGIGPFTYAWRGLPSDCTGPTSASPVCAPHAPGHLDIQAVALDGNGGRSLPSTDVFVAVSPPLVVGTPVASTGEVAVGHPVSFDVSVGGGAGGNVVNWSGLPEGCTAQSTHVDCLPSLPGTYYVAANVTDANGALASSNLTVLTVTGGPGSSNPSGLSGGGSLVAYGVIGAFVAVVVVVVVLVHRFHRPPPPAEPTAPTEPPA